jgi:hypothetical protein
MAKKFIKVTMYGGFHNSKETSILLPNTKEVKNCLKEVEEDCIQPSSLINELCTDFQRKKLEKHFCGIKGCTCGSYHRISSEFVDWKLD